MPENKVHREGLTRSVPFEMRATDEGGDGRTLDGYGAVFNSVTEINSWEGTFQEKIARGAFKKSISERTPKMQFDHGRHPLIGSIPIGRYSTVEEDSKGLHVVGRLSDNWLMEPVRTAIADGAVDGMSFRFSVIRDGWVDDTGKTVPPEKVDRELWSPSGDYLHPLVRTLKEVRVDEVGPVTWPAYDNTSVGVRALVRGQADWPALAASPLGSVTIDLDRLHEAATRAQLAKVVFMADAVTTRNDAPQSDRAENDVHPTVATVAPDVVTESPSEHPSAETMRRRARIREFAQSTRGYMLTIKGTTHDASDRGA